VSESEGLDTPPVPGELPGGDLTDAASDYDMAESLVSEGLGATPGSYGIPNMIGDFFGSGAASVAIPINAIPAHPDPAHGTIPNPGSGGVVGRTKIAENTSPIPHDRLLFSYSYFDNVPLHPRGVNVQRFTPGIEKTFLGGMMSFEMKVPMAITLDTTSTLGAATDVTQGELGNMLLTPKLLLFQQSTWAMSAGMTISVPTARDVHVVHASGTRLVRIDNESVNVGPFIGLLSVPNERLFVQAFLQYEFDTNGSPVSLNPDGTGLQSAGRLKGTTFQYFDVSAGCWVRPNVALTGEIHWNRSLGDPDVVAVNNFAVGDLSSTIEIINAVIGAHIELTYDTTVTIGYAMPIGGGQDQQFDGELRFMVNQALGRSRMARRTR